MANTLGMTPEEVRQIVPEELAKVPVIQGPAGPAGRDGADGMDGMTGMTGTCVCACVSKNTV